jgi:O-antigen ligase
MAALYCLVLVFALPAKSTGIRIAQGMLAIAATVLTFSKTGMIILLALTLIYVAAKRSILLMAAVAAVVVSAWSLISLIFEADLFSLSWNQRARLADVLNLAMGDINDRSTTGRNFLLDFGTQRIMEALPWGAGIGQFHAMDAGWRNPGGEWLGIHNTFLMLVGEAGIIPLVLAVAFFTTVLICGARTRYPIIIYGFAIILIGDMMTSHNVLMLRVPDVAFAVVAALAASTANSIQPRRLPHEGSKLA